MPATATLLYQEHHVNSKTTLVQIIPTGAYPGDPGESVSLDAGSLLNPGALTVTGPNGFPPIPPRVSSTQSGGWQMQLIPTAVAGVYNVSFWNGSTELTAIAYPAPVLAGVFIVALDHDLQGY